MLSPPMTLPLEVTLTTLLIRETFLLHTTLILVASNGGVIPPPIIPTPAWPFTTLALSPTRLVSSILSWTAVQNPSVSFLGAALGPLNTTLTPLWIRPTKTVTAPAPPTDLDSPCKVRDTRCVRRFTRELFTLFLTLVCGISVVIELTIITLIVFDEINVLVTLRFRLFALGRESSNLLTLIFKVVVHPGLKVRLVLTNVVMLFPPRILVTVRRVIAAPFDDLGLHILTTWFSGQLFIFNVILSVNELSGIAETPALIPLLSPTIEFPLKPSLTPPRVLLKVPRSPLPKPVTNRPS